MFLKYILYDVFTSQPYSGNPLAVFVDPDGVNDTSMSQIATELNLSETVFVFRNAISSMISLRIFTPKTELPFAGHPTIGAAIALKDAGLNTDSACFSVKAGEIPITFNGPTARFTAPLSPIKSPATRTIEDTALLLGINHNDIEKLAICDCGVPFTIIHVRSRKTLASCSLNITQWRDKFATTSAPHIYVVHERHTNNEIHARMFAPAMGIEEDPATGGAAVALAALLKVGRYRILQGEDMGRPSELDLIVNDKDVQIGGMAVKIGHGEIQYPVVR